MGCKSCGKEWVDHVGIEGTCQALLEAQARIAELERIYDDQHRELTAGLEYQAGIMEVLAEAILEEHTDRGHCESCPYLVVDLLGGRRCAGTQYDCCKCPACGVARKVLGYKRHKADLLKSKSCRWLSVIGCQLERIEREQIRKTI